jgi:hypothetical protein
MTTLATAHNPRHRQPAAVVTAALLTLLLTLAALGTASSLTDLAAGTRVRDLHPAPAAIVGAPTAASPTATGDIGVHGYDNTAASTVATNALDDVLGAITRPAGVADDWIPEVAASGRGTVWRAPGSTGNAGTVRIMEPTAQYPTGYARFYNEYGQPIGLNGRPGPNSVTHIPLNVDGTYQLPKGWGG